jgi:hypothetical protein
MPIINGIIAIPNVENSTLSLDVFVSAKFALHTFHAPLVAVITFA